jgi:Cu/Ag efflux protein CusF
MAMKRSIMSEESKQKVREVARGMRTRRMMAGGAVGAALLASVASGAVFITSSSAASTHHSSSTSHSAATAPTVAGTVTAVDVASDSFTLKSEDGTTTTVDVTSTTTYEDRTVTSASLSDVAVGDMVAVVGTTASGVVTATDVRIGGPCDGAMGGAHAAPTAVGTVTAVDATSDSFTLKSEDGTVTTVDVTSTTTYEDRTVTSASLSDVAVGDTVAVVGTTASGVVTATDVRIGTPPTGAGFGGPGGPGGPGAPQGASSQS